MKKWVGMVLMLAAAAGCQFGDAEPGGQPKMSRPFQLQQQGARRHVLGLAFRVTPVPASAQFPTQTRAIPVRMRPQQAANRPHVRLVEPPPCMTMTLAMLKQYDKRRGEFSKNNRNGSEAVK